MSTKPAEPSRVELMLQTVLGEAMKRQIKAELQGTGIDEKRFQLAALTAIRTNADLHDCNPQSVYNAVRRAAHDGLIPDGREGIIVSFRRNVGTKQHPKWEKHAQWMPMTYGLIQKLGKAGITCDTQVVREKDEFEQAFGDDPVIKHRPPPLGQKRGEIVGVYAIVTLANNRRFREVMDLDDITPIREHSKNKEGIWKDWYGEMVRKTVLRRISKRIPLPDRVRETVESEDLNLDDVPAPEAAKPKLLEQQPNQLRELIGDQPPIEHERDTVGAELEQPPPSEDAEVL